MQYHIYNGCPVWEPAEHNTPWHELLSDRILYADNTYTPITKHQFSIYRMDKSLTLERSSAVVSNVKYEEYDDHVKLIGPMDTKEQETFKEGTIFVLSDQTLSWGFYYQFNNDTKDIETPPQDLLDLPNRSFQQVIQRILPDATVQFSGLDYHNDVLINGKKVVGTVIMSNGTGMFQHGLCTWYYDHAFFSKVLPQEQLLRIARQHGDGQGITGICNELQNSPTNPTNYTLDNFLQELIKQIQLNVALFEDNHPEF